MGAAHDVQDSSVGVPAADHALAMTIATGHRGQALEPGREAVAPQETMSAPPRPLRVVFVLKALSSLRFFQSSLELLLERGHHVRLVLEDWSRSGNVEQAWLDRMLERPNFTYDYVRGLRKDRWHKRGL